MIYLSMLSKSCLYGRSPCYRSNVIKNIIRCCTQGVVHQKKKRTSNDIISERFPGYKVVYMFPHIKYVSYLNIIKWQQTICNAVAVPIVGGLYAADLITYETGIPIITVGFFFTIWLHSIAIMCNNFIGFVYLKEDDQQLILSYVNYWGKRVDLKTTLDNITPISESGLQLWNKLYRVVRLKSPKLKLKITTEHGEIAAVEHFHSIFGDFQ